MPTRAESLALLTGPGGPFEIGTADIGGQTLRVFTKVPTSLRDVWAASAAHGDATFLVYQDERITFAEAHVQVRKLAAHLSSAGIGTGDRVAIAMRNYPEWVLSFWAVQSLGAIVVSMNAWWTAAETEYGLADSGAVALIADGERYDRVRGEVLGRLPISAVVVVRGGALDAGHASWADILALEDPGTLPAVEIAADDDATILYTSGTTGSPKGAVGSNRNHITNIFNTLLNGVLMSVMAGPAAEGTPPAGRAVALWTFPFFHIAGVTGVTLLTLTGGCIISQYKFDAADALAIVEREHATIVAGVPTVVRTMLEHPDAATRDLSTLSGISQGGSPVPPDSIAKIETEFAGKVSPANGYGLTETTSAVIANSGPGYFAHKDSVGLPMPGTDVRIVDEDGNDVAAGGVGELWVRGPNNVRGYWNKPNETAEAFTDGWFHTGDAGRVAPDGYVYVVDRIKDMVLRGGENVYCAEVEAAIFEHAAVADVAVFGLPDARLGEEVAAVVNLQPGMALTAEELRAFLAGRLATFKIPSAIFVRTAELPRNATGKVLKKDLRAEYSAG
ncbi:MAG: AMP-dependent synthetase and ligase [Acidimicrobiales bacterium]|nr:AMP-dependent synthetase and ligase [Acidimicrobiales bacterium]